MSDVSITHSENLSSLKLLGNETFWEGVGLLEVLTPEEFDEWYAGLEPAIERVRRMDDE